MDEKSECKFENFLRSRLKVRIEFLEMYSTLFPETINDEDFVELLNKVNNLKKQNLASLFLLELHITETETQIENLLKGKHPI